MIKNPFNGGKNRGSRESIDSLLFPLLNTLNFFPFFLRSFGLSSQELDGAKTWPTSPDTEGRTCPPSWRRARAKRTGARPAPPPGSAGRSAGASTTWTATARWRRRRARRSSASVKGTFAKGVFSRPDAAESDTHVHALRPSFPRRSSEEEFVVTENESEGESESNNSGSNGDGKRRNASSRRRKPLKRRRSSRKRRRPRGYSDDEEEETDEEDEEEIGILN